MSLGFYFTELLGFSGKVFPSVTAVPDYVQAILPDTWSGFKDGFPQFGKLLVSGDNLRGYFSGIGRVIGVVVMPLMFLLPFIILVVIAVRRALKRENNDYNEDTKPLRAVKRAAKYSYTPVKKYIVGLIDFLREYDWIIKIWIFLALLNFNILTVALEFIAYLFYLAASVNFSGFYIQFYKLVLDLGIMFKAIPVWTWFIAGYVIFLRLRRKIAYARLRHLEMRDRGFINSLPVVFLVCATMNKKKTTMITDMALSQDVMFRDKAFEKLLENDLKFPYFPWINLENEIKEAMSDHRVYNLATCKEFIRDKYKDFVRNLKWCKRRGISLRQYPRLLFDYDFLRYGTTYDDKLEVVDLWEVLEVYTQLYFIYVIQSSLLVANYSIRTDAVIMDTGNFPLWNADFFRRDSRLIDSFSRHAHILDFDMLRLGRKFIEESRNVNAFEFGVIVMTEAGKERGNMLDTKELKKNSAEVNQKNDLFNMWLKMARHSATVDKFPFIRVIMDEQRPESMGADVRELCDLVHIRESSDQRLALPLFFLENLTHDFVFSRFERFYYDYRHNRGDNTLIMYAFKKLAAVFHNYYARTYNLFSFYVLQVETERGTQDGKHDEHKYYLMSKKIYAKRFATDAFSDYFVKKSLRSPVGLADLKEYDTERATLPELEAQNSYFIDEIQEHFGE